MFEKLIGDVIFNIWFNVVKIYIIIIGVFCRLFVEGIIFIFEKVGVFFIVFLWGQGLIDECVLLCFEKFKDDEDIDVRFFVV